MKQRGIMVRLTSEELSVLISACDIRADIFTNARVWSAIDKIEHKILTAKLLTARKDLRDGMNGSRP
jgi:hypothetical protein